MKILQLLPLFLSITIYSIEKSSMSEDKPVIYDIIKLHTHTFDFDQRHYPTINGFRLIRYKTQENNPEIFSAIKTGKVFFETLEDGTISFKLQNSDHYSTYFLDPEMLIKQENENFLLYSKEE